MPSATLIGSSTGLSTPDGIAFDSGGNMYVVNETAGGTGTLEVFTTTSGNVAPSETYSPGRFGPALNAAGDIAVVGVDNSTASTVVIYPPFVPGASGVLPIATIQGSNTGLYNPVGVAYH
jgi:DNA-binding beta-propeller fold protein YncE